MSELTHPETQPAEVEFKLANAWRRKGKASRAIAGYRRAIALQPEYILAMETVEAMTTTILSWARDEQLRRRVGRECKRRAEEEFRSERMLEEYLHIVAPFMARQPTNSVYE